LKYRYIYVICLCLPVLCFFASCSLLSINGRADCYKVVTWNVQTFFDAVRNGSEYPEFSKSYSNWSRDSYVCRLERLCKAVNQFDADIIILQEIENKGILYDISNQLADNSWFGNKNYSFGCFASASGSAVGCAVLSRYPLAGLTVHSLDIRRADRAQPSLRPVMEVTVATGAKKLILYVNHWKSKSGDKQKSDIWRTWQESVLAGLIIGRITVPQPGTAGILACGDFNRDIAEFTAENAENYPGMPEVMLHHICPGRRDSVSVYTPWLDGRICKIQGSYYYRGKWERIDHFFSAGNIRITSFGAETEGPWIDKSGIPVKYSLYNGSGYSDHLPLYCIIGMQKKAACAP
jgi:endonuclease/exonuclease/phosphatase family metal-dependent hydrolase